MKCFPLLFSAASLVLLSQGEWLFPAVLLADLDLESINLSDQFVLTYLAGDVFPGYAGGLPPGTADLGLGFRLHVGFLQLQHPNALFLAAVGV